jgi:FkbM family methyltransferase
MNIPYRIGLLFPRPIRTIGRGLVQLGIFSGVRSVWNYWSVIHGKPSSPSPEEVSLRVRALGGRRAFIRPNTTDGRVLFDAFFHRYHLPPPRCVGRDARVILDLGSNIGLTTAHFAVVFPLAQIIGVELDSANQRVAMENTAPWREQCELIHSAIWPTDGQARYRRAPGCEDGFSVISSGAVDGCEEVPAVSINTLVESRQLQSIDFVKMDIEGAERAVLRQNTEWAGRVRCLKVELHGSYSKEDARRDLEGLGFQAWYDRFHPRCVVGVRRA